MIALLEFSTGNRPHSTALLGCFQLLNLQIGSFSPRKSPLLPSEGVFDYIKTLKQIWRNFVLMSPVAAFLFSAHFLGKETKEHWFPEIETDYSSAFGHPALWARQPGPLLPVLFGKSAGVLLCYYSSSGSGFRVSTVNLESLQAL